jgi:hypothetical protein
MKREGAKNFFWGKRQIFDSDSERILHGIGDCR